MAQTNQMHPFRKIIRIVFTFSILILTTSATVYVQSGDGSFNSIAAKKLVEKYKTKSQEMRLVYSNGSQEDALRLAKKHSSLAFLAYKNSISGNVQTTFDARKKIDFDILDRISIPIHMALSCTKGTTLKSIEKIYAHPQGLLQIKSWLGHNGDNIKLVSITQGATKAAKLVSQNANKKNLCVLGPKRLAKIYNLQTLATKIEDQKGNKTEFILVRPNHSSIIGSPITVTK